MYKTSKYSEKTNQDLEFRVLHVLLNSEDALSIQQIQQKDMILSNHTPQKLARVLGKLIDMSFVRKNKSKSSNRMMYKAVSVMLAQGYAIDDGSQSGAAPAAAQMPTMPMIPNWELVTERTAT